MVFLFFLVGALLMVTAEARVGNSSEVPFCFESEQCLLFDQICKADGYEVRHYDSVKWVSTEEKGHIMEFAAMRAFMRLYKYIKGENKNGKRIQMTAPVVTKIVPKKPGTWEANTYTMCFLLPAEHQKNPPQPTDPDVLVHETPDMKVYVRSFGGWMSHMEEENQRDALCSTLDSVSAKYQKASHYAVGYNSPMTMFNRHNEVWFAVEGDPVCPPN